MFDSYDFTCKQGIQILEIDLYFRMQWTHISQINIKRWENKNDYFQKLQIVILYLKRLCIE